eukprot:symbB.v1.2.041983.t1/scaffold8970.1/size4537/1
MKGSYEGLLRTSSSPGSNRIQRPAFFFPGRRMAEFPMDPQQSKSLIQADKYKCVDEVVTICSMLGVDGAIFYRPKDKGLHADNARKNFHKPGGDHMTMLHVYK